MTRSVAEEEFFPQGRQLRWENKPQISVPQGKGVGIFMEYAGGLGMGKGDWRQGKCEVTGVLQRGTWLHASEYSKL